MSRQESPKTSSSGSAPQFIKEVEKLVKTQQPQIDSDEDDSLAQKMSELQKHFPILKKIMPFMSNAQKISLFLRDHNFRNRLSIKLKQQGILNAQPILKVHLYSIRYHSVFEDQLNSQDLWQTFSKFGTVTNLYCDKKFAYVEYPDYVAAFMAIKTLNDFQLEGETLRISVRWAAQLEETLIAENYFMALPQSLGLHSDFVKLNHMNGSRYMCRYDLYLDDHPQFKAAQKLIGPKGSYMKRILDRSISPRGADISHIEQLVKLRLRGKGSGYKEGHNDLESEDRLNLCISSRQEEVYLAVCIETQKLLLKVAEDYKLYVQRLTKKPLEGVAYQKVQFTRTKNQLVKQFSFEEIDSTYDFINKDSNKKITESQILQIIKMREQARKCGNWRVADEMRNQLKKRGVVLIDQKSNKGRQKKVKWKFMDQ